MGVPKLDGRDIFESEEMIEFTLIDISELSAVGSGVQRTVGKETLCVLLIVGFCSVSGESAILFCNKDINKVRNNFIAMRQEYEFKESCVKCVLESIVKIQTYGIIFRLFTPFHSDSS